MKRSLRIKSLFLAFALVVLCAGAPPVRADWDPFIQCSIAYVDCLFQNEGSPNSNICNVEYNLCIDKAQYDLSVIQALISSFFGMH